MKNLLVFLLLTEFTSASFLSGVDLSASEFFESFGAIYRDEHGQSMDIFEMMKINTIDIIRLRLFTSNEKQAQQDPYDYGNTLNSTLRLAHRVKTHGFQFMLDFHYSDTWADPSHQRKPSTWANLTFGQLNQTLYNYTRDSLLTFVQQNIIPEYIQIGNEINNGMLWPDGSIKTNWPQFVTLLSTASRAVRLVLQNQTKIIVHSANSNNWILAKNFFDHLIATVDFDIIGLSYYPYWDGGFTGLRYCLEQLTQTYNKQIFIVETNYRWKEDPYGNDSMKNVTGFDETPLGQMQYAEYLEHLLFNSTDNRRDTALFWWGTEYFPVQKFNKSRNFNRSFFNTSGIALPIVKSFGKFKFETVHTRLLKKSQTQFNRNKFYKQFFLSIH
mgnify:FL=1